MKQENVDNERQLNYMIYKKKNVSKKKTDAESDLLGITRKNTHCRSDKFQPLASDNFSSKYQETGRLVEHYDYPQVSLNPLYDNKLDEEYNYVNKKTDYIPPVAPIKKERELCTIM
jgi:hypothetical protein